MATPIVKVYDADGQLIHDCAAAGCESSWDGYDLAGGAAVADRTDPSPQWDTSTPGVARLIGPSQ